MNLHYRLTSLMINLSVRHLKDEVRTFFDLGKFLLLKIHLPSNYQLFLIMTNLLLPAQSLANTKAFHAIMSQEYVELDCIK